MPSYVANLQMNGFEVKNFLIDKLTAAQIAAISSPVDGRPVYDTTNSQFLFRQNGQWKPLGMTGTLPLSQLEDDATADLPLLSGGSGGDPHYAKIDLSSTASLQGRLPLSSFVQTGTAGQALLSGGNAADAAYGAINLAGGASIVSGKLPLANITNGGTAGQPLLAGAGSDPVYGALDLSDTNVTSNRLPLSRFAAGATAGQPLLAAGTGTDSVYGALDLANANAITGDLPLANLTDNGTSGQPLLSGGGTAAYGALDLANSSAITNRLPLGNFATGTSGYPLLGQGAGSPIYGQVDLAVGVTGTLQAGQMPALTGDVSNSGLTVTVNSVNAATYAQNTAANIADAVDKRHAQNTDTGTTSATFQLDSGNSGIKLKNAAGEGQIRNGADTAFADLRVRNLVVEGTQTIVNSATVSIADNMIEVNGETGDPAANSSGGIEIRRLGALSAGAGTIAVTAGSTTITGTGTNFTNGDIGKGIKTAGGQSRRIVEVTSTTSAVVDVVFATTESGASYELATPDNAKIEFNISTSRWQANFGAVGSTQTQLDLVLRKAQDCDAGASTTVTHNFGTRDVTVTVYDKTTNDVVIADVNLGLNSVTVNFGSAVGAGDYRIVVMG